MPGIIIHRYLAEKIARESQLPFNARAEGLIRRAYFEGMMGPDMGAFPGTDTLISNLSHYVRSGELAARLLARAGDEVERAFAWGWITHVAADIAIHPLVNRGVGELRHGDPSRVLTWEEDPVSHLRVELGLDGAFFYRMGCTDISIPSTILTPVRTRFIAAAYRDVYGIDIEPQRFIASQRRALIFHGRLLRAAQIFGWLQGGGALPWRALPDFFGAYLPLRLVRGVLGKNSPYFGAVSCINPGEWLMAATLEAVDSAAERVDRLVSGSESLENFHLDAGTLQSEGGGGSPLANRTLAELTELRSVQL